MLLILAGVAGTVEGNPAKTESLRSLVEDQVQTKHQKLMRFHAFLSADDGLRSSQLTLFITPSMALMVIPFVSVVGLGFSLSPQCDGQQQQVDT